jgi:hypothetical protein
MTIQRWLGSFLLMVAVVALVGCGSSSAPVGVSLASTGPSSTWTGTWTNGGAATNGALSFALATNSTTGLASVTVTFGGSSTSFFGGPPPPPTTFTGPFNAQTFVVNQTDPKYGTAGITWGQSYYVGKITGSLVNLPSAAVSRVDFIGLANSGNISLTFTITLANGTTQTGSASVNKA